MKFGKYDREDATLVCVYEGGGIEFFIVRRKASFNRKNLLMKQTEIGNIKMPKMSQAYLEQIEYEKENSKQILQNFQYDLSYVRLLGKNSKFRLKFHVTRSENKKFLIFSDSHFLYDNKKNLTL